VCATSGLTTIVVKATPGGHQGAEQRLLASLAKGVEKGKLTAEAAAAARANLTFTSDRDALGGADLVVESIVEDLAEKRRLFGALDAVLAPGAIVATNTSTLRVSELARGLGRETHTVGLHFFSPVPAMKLVELAHLPGTDAAVLAEATRFVARLGKTAVPVLDSTGFVVNRLLVPYLIGAIAAYEQGLARAEEIDTAMKLGCGHPMGPLALSDLIGLDVVYAMAKLLYADFGDQRYQPPSLLRKLVQDGHLGKKTGKGLYDYAAAPRAAKAA